MKTYKEYKDFWDTFLNKWLKNHDDFIQNDSEGQAFFPKDSRSNLVQTDLYKNITYMPEPYYLGSAFLNATGWSDFNDAIVVLDLNPGLSHDSDYRKSKDAPCHDILDNLAKGKYSTMINPKYSPFINTDSSIPGVTWWKSKRLIWFNRFLSLSNIHEKMFAFELCPFHSKSWNVKLDTKSVAFVKNNVLAPVASILTGNEKKRLGYCLGKEWENIFKIFGFERIAQWGIDYDNPDKPFVCPDESKVSKEDWPKRISKKNTNDEPINLNRVYKLYRGNINNKEINLLCLRASGTFTAPGIEFQKVEKHIKEDLTKLYGISL